jgi:hypothetical protein
MEMGIGYYGPVNLGNFGENTEGSFPLIQPTFGVTAGTAMF